MGTLILTSSSKFFMFNDINKFLPKKITDLSILHITTASNDVLDASYIKNHQKNMSDLNYNFESYDIEGKTSKELKAKVKNFDIIFISGGNNFYLLKIIRESGFDTVLKKWLRQKKKSA